MSDKVTIPDSARKALLSKDSSRQNKLWLITGWQYFKPWYIDWKWAGAPYNSRILFRFEPDGEWIKAESFDEDVLPLYKFSKEKS
jgi:hypothetical protein